MLRDELVAELAVIFYNPQHPQITFDWGHRDCFPVDKPGYDLDTNK